MLNTLLKKSIKFDYKLKYECLTIKIPVSSIYTFETKPETLPL